MEIRGRYRTWELIGLTPVQDVSWGLSWGRKKDRGRGRSSCILAFRYWAGVLAITAAT